MSVARFPRVVLLGDSLTEMGFSADGRWVASVANALVRTADVVNRGLSGYTTKTLKAVSPTLLSEEGLLDGAVAVTLFIGANDANLKEINPDQHVPLDEYKENLSYLLSSLFERGVTRDQVIIVPPPPNDPEVWKKALEAKRNVTLTAPPKNNETNRLYYDAALAFAAEMGCESVETWDALNHPDMFSDGLHFSAKGANTIFQLVWPAIEKRTSTLEQRFPDWKDLVIN